MVDIPSLYSFFVFFLFLDLIYRLPEADFGLVWFGLAKQIGQNRRKRAVAVLPGLPCQGLGYPEQPSRLHTLRTIHTWRATKRRYGKRPARPFSTAPSPAPRIVLDWPYPLHRNSPTTKRVSLSLSIHSLSTTATVAASTLQNAATPKTEHKQIPIIITVNKNKNKNKHRTQNTEHTQFNVRVTTHNPSLLAVVCM